MSYLSLFSRPRSATTPRRNVGLLALVAIAAMMANPAFAALPAAVAPAGVAAGDYVGLWQALLKAGVNVIVLGVGAWAFWKVAGGGLTKWSDYQKGRIELSDIKEYFIGGSIVLVVMVALLTVANGIL